MRLALQLLLLLSRLSFSFRVVDPEADDAPPAASFPAYARGFVGRDGDPSTPRAWRAVPGGPHSLANPQQYRSVLPRQSCPAMVGPFEGGLYGCTSASAGFCDRRTGVCYCSRGYAGADCGMCRATHKRDPTGACVPRVQCPSDCSGAGVCDAETGVCACAPGRRGVDCSLDECRLLDRWCEACDVSSSTFLGGTGGGVCVRCAAGRYLDPSTGACASCAVFDPRCAECSADAGCLACADSLLSSTRRSGRRRQDAPLPWDEDARVLSSTTPFGSQDARAAFDAAEAYAVVSDARALARSGVLRGSWSPAEVCLRASGLLSNTTASACGSGGAVRMAVVEGEGAGAVGAAPPAVYDISCGRVSPADAFYGFGAEGVALEGPVRGAVLGRASAAPIVYPPGVASIDSTAIVRADGFTLADDALVDMTMDLLNDVGEQLWLRFGWAAAVERNASAFYARGNATLNATVTVLMQNCSAVLASMVNGSQFDVPSCVNASALLNATPPTFPRPAALKKPEWATQGGVWPLVHTDGIDVDAWSDYDGYRVAAVRGWLLSNETGCAGLNAASNTTLPCNAWGAVLCVNSTWIPRPPPGSAYVIDGGAHLCAPAGGLSYSPPGLGATPAWALQLPAYFATRLRALRTATLRRLASRSRGGAARRHLFAGGAAGTHTLPVAVDACAPATLIGSFSLPGGRGASQQQSVRYLNSTTFACAETSPGRNAWSCAAVARSNVVCGAPGTIEFASPRYVAVEGGGDVRVTVTRSGGGVGRVTALLSLSHGTTSDADVALPGSAAGARTLVFEEGVVALTVSLVRIPRGLQPPPPPYFDTR